MASHHGPEQGPRFSAMMIEMATYAMLRGAVFLVFTVESISYRW